MKKAAPMKGSFMTDAALFVLRLSGLGLALAHGWPKIERLLSGQGAPFIEGVANLGFPYPTVFAWAATRVRRPSTMRKPPTSSASVAAQANTVG